MNFRFRATALAAMICLAGAAAWGDTSATLATQDGTTTSAAVEAAQTLGLNPSGFIQLPNQWSLKPAGKSLPLGDFPAAVVASPDRKYAAVLHCGFSQHEVRIMDVEHEKEISSAPQKNMWIGAAWSPDGKALYVSGGANDVLIKYPVNKGKLGPGQRIELPVTHDTYDVPADKLAPQMAVDHVQSNQRKRPRFPAGMAMDPNGKTIYLAEMYANRIVQVDLPDTKDKTAKARTRVLATFEENSNPYRVALDDKHKVVYVSLWGSSAVAAYNLSNGEVHRIPTDPHPNELAFSKNRDRLFVSCANTNCVNVIDTRFRQITEKLNTALYPDSPEGSTPNSLTVTADGDTLVVANADNNNLVLYDIEERDKSIPQGFIPTGWYPTGVVTGPKDKLLAVCGKGNGSMANPVDDPVRGQMEIDSKEYIGGLLRGSAEFIPFPDEEELEEYSATARQCSPLQKDMEVVGREDAGTSNPIPTALGQLSPIKYVVYIIKENRTYDQVLGDMKEGNGDPRLCLFGEDVTPNHHALAREFVLLDNFYCDAEVSADGHEWSMGAYATDYVERTWPSNYGGHGALRFPAEGRDPNGNTSTGYLWDRAREAGISYRSYGEWVSGGARDEARSLAPALVGHICPDYPQFDMSVLEEDKAATFTKELKEFEAKGELPRLMIIRLPNDHTAGTRKGWRTPTAYVAEHDQGLGTILEALSQSKFWPEMAVFMVEDDAQNGSDHVDAHRTVAMVAGPHVKRGYVDHTLYSTTSMLRTMELILGLEPMSQFDAAARPMFNCFTATPDTTPYKKKPARVSLTEKNGDKAPMVKESAKLDLTHEDANPDVAFNEIIWKSVKGADSAMPPPVRAAYIKPIKDDDDEDD